MTAVAPHPGLDAEAATLAEQLVEWLQSGVRPRDMFADEVFTDLSLPQWRLQAEGAEAAFALREDNHPFPGTVTVESVDRSARGFLLRFEERWDADGQRWYSRELIHCAVTDGRISELVVYCTGDWDENVQRRHAEQVSLLRKSP